MQLVEPRPHRPIPMRITPLIDVVFILLVFFMLTSRLLPVDYLELANNTSASRLVAGNPLPLLTVTADGRIQWQGKTLTVQRLESELAGSGITEANLATVPNATLGAFTRTLSALTESGIEVHWQRPAGTSP